MSGLEARRSGPPWRLILWTCRVVLFAAFLGGSLWVARRVVKGEPEPAAEEPAERGNPAPRTEPPPRTPIVRVGASPWPRELSAADEERIARNRAVRIDARIPQIPEMAREWGPDGIGFAHAIDEGRLREMGFQEIEIQARLRYRQVILDWYASHPNGE